MATKRKVNGRWQARFYDRNRSPKRKNWTLQTSRKDVARRTLTRLEEDYEKGKFDPWKGGYQHERISVSEARDRFLQSRKDNGLRPDTIERYTFATKGLVEDLPPGLMIPDLRGDQIRPYINDSEVKNGTQRNRYVHLNVWFNWCEDEGYLPDGNPMADVKKPREEEKEPRSLNPAEVKALLNTIDTYHQEASSRSGRDPNDQWLKEVIRFAVSTGLRRGELLSLKWKDVELENEMLLVRNREDGSFKTKSGDERTVPLSRQAVSVLNQIAEVDGAKSESHVFTDDDGGEIRADRVSKRFKKYVREAELSGGERISFHDLRHTFATRLIMNGTPTRVVQEILGHNSVKVTERYSHLCQNAASSAVQETFGEIDREG